MSANNWTICPRCRWRAGVEARAAEDRTREAYGKVPVDEYKALLSTAAVQPKLGETFSEYYELGLTNDASDFWVDYSGQCNVCGFEHRFKHTEKLKAEG